MKNITVIQNGYKDCAPSCLLSIIRYYGGDISHEELSILLKTDNGGTNAYNLISGAKSIGFDGYGIKYSLDEIIENNITLPVIAHVIKNNYYHYVVIYKIDSTSKKINIMDPDVGNTTMNFESFNDIYQGTILVLYPVKKLPVLDKKNTLYNHLLNNIKDNKKEIIIVFIISLIVVILSILSNYYIKVIIDKVVYNYVYKNLLLISLLFFNIMFYKSFLSYIRNRILVNLINKISISLNKDSINHIFNLPYLFFKNKSTGEVLSRLNDLKSLKDVLSNMIANVMLDLMLVIISMIVLLIINYKLFLICLVSMIMYFIVVFAYKNIIKKQINNIQVNEGNYNKVLTESVEGYETFKNINLLKEISLKINNKYNEYSSEYVKYQNTLSTQMFIKDMIMDITYILVVFVGTKYVNMNILSLSSLVVFNALLVYFTEPLKDILDMQPQVDYIKGVFNRLNDLLILNKEKVNTNKMIKGDISIKHLTYSYDYFNKVINNISLNIKHKDKILIYGSSGIGKSTIFKILLKYLDNYEGNIYIGGTNLKKIDSSVINNSITYVSQNSYVINDTLKNNIIFDRNISNEEYMEILDICNINKIIEKSELKDNFIIEDNGFNISGGERQKIILARSLLKKSNIYILDEALSEVSFDEEKEIINKIINKYKDKTIIFCSHKEEVIELFKNKYYLERSI